MSLAEAKDRVEKWFAGRGIVPFEFQHAVWDAYLAGKSGLIQAPTGMGKTLAAAMGPVMEYLSGAKSVAAKGKNRRAGSEPIAVLWVTPLRALAADTVQSLQAVV